MTPRVSVSLAGVKDLIEALKSLPERVEKNVLRFALRTAAKPILTGAKIRAPVNSGNLKKSLKIKAAKRNKNNKHRVTFTVGTGSGHNLFAGKLFYGGFQELGWLAGKRNSGQKWAQKVIREERKAGPTDNPARLKKLRQANRVAAADKRKKIPGLHYVKRAFDDNSGRAVTELENLIRQGLEREAEKAAKKQAIATPQDAD